ncbi:hypothetical protein DL768_000739 [Monosporascus sp. mg162]|nr:hypothetical protein DL768_000739 [Monosporascus sp. mg162]
MVNQANERTLGCNCHDHEPALPSKKSSGTVGLDSTQLAVLPFCAEVLGHGARHLLDDAYGGGVHFSKLGTP